MQITFAVDGVIELARNLRIASNWIALSLGEFHQEAVSIVKERSDELFSNAGANVQNWPSWKSLSPTTERMRAKRSGYYKKEPNNPWVLRWTGRLQNSAVQSSNKQEGSLEYTAPYAIKHQRGWPRLPRRKIIDIDMKTSTKIVKALQRIVNDQIWIFWRQK